MLLTACHGKKEAPAALPPRVVVSTVVARDMPVYYETIGHVTPYRSAQIKPQVSGQILKVHIEDGATVQEGQLLFTIDPSAFQAAYDEAAAQLAQDQAAVGLNRERVDRYQKLLEAQYVSQLDYSTYESQLRQSEATLDLHQARLRAAELNLNWAQVKAPFTGRAGRVLLHEGNLAVAQSSELLVLNQLTPIHVAFSVPEIHLPFIQQHQKEQPLQVEIEVPGVDMKKRRAPLVFVNNSVATNTGTIPLEAMDTNEDLGLWPGQYVKVQLIFEQLHNALLLPESAVSRDAQGEFVYLVDAQSMATKHPVRLLAQAPSTPDGLEGSWVVALAGVNVGDVVVAAGQQRLTSGTKVRVDQTR
jgi:RND family efflux transporter MFP subunit